MRLRVFAPHGGGLSLIIVYIGGVFYTSAMVLTTPYFPNVQVYSSAVRTLCSYGYLN